MGFELETSKEDNVVMVKRVAGNNRESIRKTFDQIIYYPDPQRSRKYIFSLSSF